MDGQVVEVFRRVDIVQTLAEAVYKDTGPGSRDLQLGVGEVVPVKRQEGGVTVLVGPDQTCGYRDGLSGEW